MSRKEIKMTYEEITKEIRNIGDKLFVLRAQKADITYTLSLSYLPDQEEKDMREKLLFVSEEIRSLVAKKESLREIRRNMREIRRNM